jgi:hypothetical protein
LIAVAKVRKMPHRNGNKPKQFAGPELDFVTLTTDGELRGSLLNSVFSDWPVCRSGWNAVNMLLTDCKDVKPGETAHLRIFQPDS